MWRAWYISPILTKFGSSRQIFINVRSNKFHRYPSSESLADTCEQTDGRDEANRRFSRQWERALKQNQKKMEGKGLLERDAM